jgi:hypothetical protein
VDHQVASMLELRGGGKRRADSPENSAHRTLIKRRG